MSGRPTADILDDWYGMCSLEGRMATAQDAIDRLVEYERDAHRLSELLEELEAENDGLRDRLAELDAKVDDIDAMYRFASMKLKAVLDSLPPCPTCGGTKRITNPQWLIHTLPCPDCIDGKVSIERLVAVFNAVWDKRLDPNGSSIDGTITYLRSVKPQPR